MGSPAFSVSLGNRSLVSPLTKAPSTTCSLQGRPLSRRKVLTNIGRAAILLSMSGAAGDVSETQAGEEQKVQETSSGLKYIELTHGDGPKPTKGQSAKVHYTLTLGGFDGKVVDSSFERKKPFRFNVGTGQVIKGWDEGLMMMNVGSKWQLIIPSELGYGKNGAGGVIPPNATLYFLVELLGLDK